jgi:hypothetical protein
VITRVALALAILAAACGEDRDATKPDIDPEMREAALAVLDAPRQGDPGPALRHAVRAGDREAVLAWKAAEGSISEERLEQARAEWSRIIENAREEIRVSLPRCRSRGREMGIDWAEVELIDCEDGGGDDIYIAFRHREAFHVVIARSGSTGHAS